MEHGGGLRLPDVEGVEGLPSDHHPFAHVAHLDPDLQVDESFGVDPGDDGEDPSDLLELDGGGGRIGLPRHHRPRGHRLLAAHANPRRAIVHRQQMGRGQDLHAGVLHQRLDEHAKIAPRVHDGGKPRREGPETCARRGLAGAVPFGRRRAETALRQGILDAELEVVGQRHFGHQHLHQHLARHQVQPFEDPRHVRVFARRRQDHQGVGVRLRHHAHALAGKVRGPGCRRRGRTCRLPSPGSPGSLLSRAAAMDLVQNPRQLGGLAVLDGADEELPPAVFAGHVDALEPMLHVVPGRVAVGDDEELIDPRQREEPRGERFTLPLRSAGERHRRRHLPREVAGRGRPGPVQLHADAAERFDVDQGLDLRQSSNI